MICYHTWEAYLDYLLWLLDTYSGTIINVAFSYKSVIKCLEIRKRKIVNTLMIVTLKAMIANPLMSLKK